MTTREEQEQYRISGMQDGKVEELIKHEKRTIKKQEVEAGPSDKEDSSDVRQTAQDKKKKRKKRKKNKKEEEPTPKKEEGKEFDRFKHNIMASHDL